MRFCKHILMAPLMDRPPIGAVVPKLLRPLENSLEPQSSRDVHQLDLQRVERVHTRVHAQVLFECYDFIPFKVKRIFYGDE